MKLAFVSDSIYPYNKGGKETRSYELAVNLAKRGHEVHFYTMKFWKGKDVIKQNGFYLHGICKAKPLYIDKGRRSISQAIYFGMNCIKLIKEDFDVVDADHMVYFHLFPVKLACLIKNKPMIITWHEVWGKDYWTKYMGKKGIIGYLMEKISSRLPNKIIAISNHTKENLIKKLNVNKEKIKVIPNAINFQNIQKIKPSKASPRDHPGGRHSDVIFAGRFLSHKNIDVLIKAISTLKKSHPNIKCILVGDGPEKSNLQQLTKRLNLTKNIKFTGIIDDLDDVHSLMKSSKVFVLPSTREGFGITVLEANACSIPVITTSHKDNASKDLIKQGKNGFICKLNEKDIADKIKTAIKQSQKMKHGCIDEAKKYDWKNIIKKFEGVYNG
ncbi:MAG TPA: glycosyltransferase family 1 protein [Candidatus Pacearchaeota archaeon]|nr:glycosyltransferase family 1 protein [Candidatus Pacearchaeota archaeon]